MKYWIRRLALLPLTGIAISLVVFALLQLNPGGPVEAQLAAWRAEAPLANLSVASETLTRSYGLDRPVGARYLHWLGQFVRGDWGESFRYRLPVRDLVGERWALTFTLGAAALLLAYALGIPLGAWLATRREGPVLTLAQAALFAAHTLPAFVLALLLMRLLGDSRPGAVMAYAAPAVAGVAFLTRQAFVDEKSQTYVAALRARGLTEARIYRHLLPRALQPLAANFAQTVGFFLAGSVLVETVFSVRGLGRLSFEAAEARDYPVLLAIVMLIAVVQCLAGLAADAVLAFLDPRLQLEGER